jgi:hypothetical protein
LMTFSRRSRTFSRRSKTFHGGLPLMENTFRSAFDSRQTTISMPRACERPFRRSFGPLVFQRELSSKSTPTCIVHVEHHDAHPPSSERTPVSKSPNRWLTGIALPGPSIISSAATRNSKRRGLGVWISETESTRIYDFIYTSEN